MMQGFIEGKYVPLEEGEDVTASMDIVEADSPDDAMARKGGNGGPGIDGVGNGTRLGGPRVKVD